MNLTYGSQGAAVKQLQTALNNSGDGLAVDGIYGAKTADAVKAYQRDFGLGVDGSAGKNTMVSIKNTVVTLQSDLTRKGYSTKGIDGIFGGGSKSAVKAYQRAVGIDATGIAGSKTMKKLYGFALGGNQSGEANVKTWQTTIKPLYQD